MLIDPSYTLGCTKEGILFLFDSFLYIGPIWILDALNLSKVKALTSMASFPLGGFMKIVFAVKA